MLLPASQNPSSRQIAMITWSWWESSHFRIRSSRAAALPEAKVAYSSRYRKLEVASRQNRIRTR
jgi:hypothetical protein